MEAQRDWKLLGMWWWSLVRECPIGAELVSTLLVSTASGLGSVSSFSLALLSQAWDADCCPVFSCEPMMGDCGGDKWGLDTTALGRQRGRNSILGALGVPHRQWTPWLSAWPLPHREVGLCIALQSAQYSTCCRLFKRISDTSLEGGGKSQ